ncbi:hypothetical protein SUGI_0493050 [Cryptomeria japonica]|nr:hypothetical protein SUGI_0493050 [Cryptomeria japonica]
MCSMAVDDRLEATVELHVVSNSSKKSIAGSNCFAENENAYSPLLRARSNSCGCIFMTTSCESYGSIMVAMDQCSSTLQRTILQKKRHRFDVIDDLKVEKNCFLCEQYATRNVISERKQDIPTELAEKL